jgi:hypothetical protein
MFFDRAALSGPGAAIQIRDQFVFDSLTTHVNLTPSNPRPPSLRPDERLELNP